MRHWIFAAGLSLAAMPAMAECPSQATMDALAQVLIDNRPSAGMTNLADGLRAQTRLVQQWDRPMGYKVSLPNGERELARAPGTALLGHPLNVLPWLAQDLASRGERLRVGDIISLGGFSPAVPTEAGRTFTVRYEGLLAAPIEVSVHTH